jgi:hypothetical protein
LAWAEKYVRSDAAGGGDGTTDTNSGANGAWTLAEAIAAYAAGDSVNVKAGTYANTTTDRTLATSGTTTAPVRWRGFKTAAGDMDAGDAAFGTYLSGAEIPAITFTTGRFGISGSFITVSALDIGGAQVTNGQLRILTGASIHVHRCRVKCTSANASGRALSNTASTVTITASLFESTSSADVVDMGGGSMLTFMGNRVAAGANGILVSTSAACVIALNVFADQGDSAIKPSPNASTRLWLIGNTISSPVSDGIEITAAPQGIVIANNLIKEVLYGINQSSGGNVASIVRISNVINTVTSGTETGVGDHQHFDLLTTDPNFVGSGDYTPQEATLEGTALPLVVGDVANFGWPGVMQPEDAGGGGGGIIYPRSLSGGLV